MTAKKPVVNPGAVPGPGTGDTGVRVEQRLYVVHWERLGRAVKNLDQTYTAADADDLAEQCCRFALTKLASREVWVDVDLTADAMTVHVNGGRFGVGTIEDRGEFHQ